MRGHRPRTREKRVSEQCSNECAQTHKKRDSACLDLVMQLTITRTSTEVILTPAGAKVHLYRQISAAVQIKVCELIHETFVYHVSGFVFRVVLIHEITYTKFYRKIHENTRISDTYTIN